MDRYANSKKGINNCSKVMRLEEEDYNFFLFFALATIMEVGKVFTIFCSLLLFLFDKREVHNFRHLDVTMNNSFSV
jgi:hypothetical protein